MADLIRSQPLGQQRRIGACSERCLRWDSDVIHRQRSNKPEIHDAVRRGIKKRLQIGLGQIVPTANGVDLKLLQNVPRQRRPGDDGRSPACRILKKTIHKLDSRENPMNNEIQKFDFKGAPLRTLTDKAEEPGSSPRTYATSSGQIQGTYTRFLSLMKSPMWIVSTLLRMAVKLRSSSPSLVFTVL